MKKKKTHQSSVAVSARMSLHEVQNFMAKNYNQPLSINTLASLTGLSPNYFGEAFKNAYGQSATDYLTTIRMGQAKQLLCNSDLLLRDIAQQVGYSDEFYFSRKFKREVGISPSTYNRAFRKRVSTFSVPTTGNLLALGIIPVAAPLNAKWSPYYFNYYQEKINVHLNIFDSESEENYKRILSAKPDIHVFQEEPSIAMMNRLEMTGIRTVCIEAMDWKSQLREIAVSVERQSNCESFIQTYEQKLVQARKDIIELVGEETFAILRLSEDQLFLYCNKGIHDVLFTDLQLNLIDWQRQTCNVQILLEDLLDIDPDRLLLIICPDAVTRNYWLSLQYLENWRKLKAVKNGHVYVLPSNPWFEYSAIAINRMLDEMLLMLTGKNPNPFPVFVHGVLSDTEL